MVLSYEGAAVDVRMRRDENARDGSGEGDRGLGSGLMPTAQLFAAMGRFNEELVEAGIMQAGEVLKPSGAGQARGLRRHRPRSPSPRPGNAARFEETAKELCCDDAQALDAAFGKIVPPKVAKAGRGSQGRLWRQRKRAAKPPSKVQRADQRRKLVPFWLRMPAPSVEITLPPRKLAPS